MIQAYKEIATDSSKLVLHFETYIAQNLKLHSETLKIQNLKLHLNVITNSSKLKTSF